MTTTQEKESRLKVLFESSTSDAKKSGDPITAIRALAEVIEEMKLEEPQNICALLRKEMGPRIGKGPRWFSKYLDAKYKQPQAPHTPQDPVKKEAEAMYSVIHEVRKATGHTPNPEPKTLLENEEAMDNIIYGPDVVAEVKAMSERDEKLKKSTRPRAFCDDCRYFLETTTYEEAKKAAKGHAKENDHHCFAASPEKIEKIGDTTHSLDTSSKAKAENTQSKTASSPDAHPPAEDEAKGGRDGQPAADSAGKKGRKEEQAPIQQVERTREEGYEAYPGDPAKLLDQPMFSGIKYSADTIASSPLYICKKDPKDKRQNTNVCGRCGSSRLAWTQIVFREQGDGHEYLKPVSNCKGCKPVKMYCGFFQCETCHAFNFFEDELRYVDAEKQEDGSYRLKPVVATSLADQAEKHLKEGRDPEYAKQLREQKDFIKYLTKSEPASLQEAKKLIADLRKSYEFSEDARNGSLGYLRELGDRDLAHLTKMGEQEKEIADLKKQLAEQKKEKKPEDMAIQAEGKILPLLLEGPALEKNHPLREVQIRLMATSDYDAIKKDLMERRQAVATYCQEIEGLRNQLDECKKSAKLRATPEETALLETLRTENDELKDEVKTLKQQLADSSITTADKLPPSFWIFVKRDKTKDLVATIDKLNWDRKQLGFSIQTDGKFATAFKVGEPL